MHKHVLSILLASLLVVAQTTSYAQTRPRQTTQKPVIKTPSTPKPDLLVRLDGTQLEVLVTEITDKEIVYRRVNNPGGPIFRVQKADFSFIKYGSNGEIERFEKAAQPAPEQTPTTSYAPAPTTTPARTTTAYQPRPASSPANTFPRWRLGLKGAVQSASLAFSAGIPSSAIKGLVGFHAGLIADNSLGNAVTVRTQVLYSTKGCRLSDGLDSEDFSITYLEVPIDLLFKIPTASGQLLLGGGGYYAFALNGKLGSDDLRIGNGRTDNIISSDYGVRASAWYDLSSGLTLNAFYNLGLTNINAVSGGATIKNRTFGLGIGYFIFKK